MTLTQTIEVPLDRRVHFDFVVPREIPTGQTSVVIQFPSSPAKKRMTDAEELESINRNAERLNKQAMESLEYQIDIFEAGDPDL